MGRAAQLAMANLVVNVYRPVVANAANLFGKRKGTEQATNWVNRGLAKLDAKDPDQQRLRENLERRRSRAMQMSGDIEKQNAEYEKCAGDFLYWLESYAFTYDPRLKQRMIPFVPFQFQKDFYDWMEETSVMETQGIIEKSRDMGATWLAVAYFVWCWLFEDQFTGLFCSRKVSLVDAKGNPSSIMEKARIIIRGLPTWMQPKGFIESKHALKLRILNPANGSVLEGEGGKEVGRGGRASKVLVDEAAFTSNPDAIEAAISNVSDVVFWLSTPNIPGDWFNQKRDEEGARIFTMRWKRDPRKNKWQAIDQHGTVVATGQGDAPDPEQVGARRIIYPWYLRMAARFSDPAKLAREVDIDYTASSDMVVFPAKWVLAAINFDLGTNWEIKECGSDLSGDGVDKDIWTYRTGPRVVISKEIERSNQTLKARAHLNVTESVGADVLHYDTGGGYGGALHGEYHSGERSWSFDLHAIVSNAKATKRRFGDKPANELFGDFKTEIFWAVRERFRKSYELALWRAGDITGVPHDMEDCISIPNDEELVRQLGTIMYIEMSSGRLALESKKDMKKRGVKSPDKVDSMVYAFAPTPMPQALNLAQTVTVN